MDHQQITQEDRLQQVISSTPERITMPPRINKALGSSWRKQIMNRFSNTSFGSTRTSATVASSAFESFTEQDYEDDSLWAAEGEDEEDDEEEEYDMEMNCSMDFSTLRRLHSEHYIDALEQHQSFHASYDLGASLGKGAFGSVNRCMDASGETFAVKTVPQEKYNEEEIEMLQDLKDCPTVVQVKEVFHNMDESYIVMEEMAGGELFERIGEKLCYSEPEAKIVFKTLLETVAHCHAQGIAHNDIKPENILLRSKDSDTDVALADFGLAKRFRHADGTIEPMVDMVGSAEYAAPEVFNRTEDDPGYDERADIWSLGVVLYVLLGGYAPFEGDTADDIILAVGKGKYKFHRQYWTNVSREARVLIARMLQVDPNKRISLEQALASPWFEEE